MVRYVRKWKAKLGPITMVFFMVCLYLTGCTGSGTTAPSGSVSKDTPSTENKLVNKEKVKLDYWVSVDPDRWEVYVKSIDEFNKQNPDIVVEMHKEVGDNAQIQQKLLTMIAAGTSPGVIHVDTMYVEDMAKAGTIMPFDTMPGAKELASSIFEGAQDPLNIDGKIYGYPIRANSIQLVYNKKMFRDAGLDPEKPPQTFDQLLEYAVKLTKKDSKGNVEVYGYESGLTKDPHWTMHVFSPIFWSHGGNYVKDGKSGFNTEAGLKTLQYWTKLMSELKVSPTERIDKGFETGKVAMYHTGEFSIKPLKRDFPNLEFGFATLPVAANGVNPAIPLGGRALVLPKGIKNPEASWKLVQWVMSKEEQMRYTKAEVGLTPRKDLADDPWFNSNKEYKQALLDMKYAKAKAAPNVLEMNSIIADAIQKVILSGQSPQAALKEADDKYNAVLSKLK